MGRFFDVLNTPIAVLVVLVVVVGINVFLYFGHLPPEVRTDRGEPQTPSVERTERRTELKEATRPASTTVLSTTPTPQTASATASATTSATTSATSPP